MTEITIPKYAWNIFLSGNLGSKAAAMWLPLHLMDNIFIPEFGVTSSCKMSNIFHDRLQITLSSDFHFSIPFP